MSNFFDNSGVEVEWRTDISGYVILLPETSIGCIGIPIWKDADSASAVEHGKGGVRTLISRRVAEHEDHLSLCQDFECQADDSQIVRTATSVRDGVETGKYLGIV